MLIDKIKAHNEVNGFVFSAAELCLVALCSAPFGVYYLLHGRRFAGLIAMGIAANALTIAALSLQGLWSGQKDIGLSKWFNKEGRPAMASRFPNMTTDTMVVAFVTMLPFVLLLGVMYEALTRKR